MITNNNNTKKLIRLFIVIIYILFLIPLQFSQRPPGESLLSETILKSILLTIFIITELIDFYNNYSTKKTLMLNIFFGIRLLSLVLIFAYEYKESGEIEPFYINLIPLLAFYTSFIMSSKKSIAFIILLCLINILLDSFNFRKLDIDFYYMIMIILQRIFIVVIFYLFSNFWQIDRNNSLEKEKLLNQLNKSQIELRKYASEIAKTSVLEERTRIARDMHDNIGHSLTALQIQLRKAQAFFDINPNESKTAINAAIEVATSSLQDTRAVLNDLTQSDTKFSMEKKIKPIISTLKQSGIEVEENIEKEDSSCNYATLIALFRVIQEGSTNIIKHSKANKISIKLNYTKEEAHLIIEDNGIGFDSEKYYETKDKKGLGLVGLAERFELIRGSFKINSECGKGTIIIATAPKNPVKIIGEN
jgi:signal transduction histidine kinase